MFSRRIVGFGIGREYIDGAAVCRMFNQAIAGHAPPVRISTDHDPLFRFHRWLANLRVLKVEEIKSVPYVPASHPFVERLIGTIRREYLDHTFFWNSIDLRRKLAKFRAYYNSARVHRSLHGITPANRAGNASSSTASLAHYIWESHCNGLFELPSPLDWKFASDTFAGQREVEREPPIAREFPGLPRPSTPIFRCCDRLAHARTSRRRLQMRGCLHTRVPAVCRVTRTSPTPTARAPRHRRGARSAARSSSRWSRRAAQHRA